MKKKIFTKILTAMLVAASAATSSLPAYAQEYTADGTGTCRVTATVDSSYSVQVPATLELQYNSASDKYEAVYTVSAKGNILPSQAVTVRPTADSFTLTGDLTGETCQAAITQETTGWVHAGRQDAGTGNTKISDAEYTGAEGKVSAGIDKADTYTGEFSFAFSLEVYAG